MIIDPKIMIVDNLQICERGGWFEIYGHTKNAYGY